jgi:hypothetical protein
MQQNCLSYTTTYLVCTARFLEQRLKPKDWKDKYFKKFFRGSKFKPKGQKRIVYFCWF